MSGSEAKAVMPTTVPPVAFSVTELAAALVSLIAETANSVLSSVTPMAKVCVEVEPSVEVAVTSMERLVAVSKSMVAPGATVTHAAGRVDLEQPAGVVAQAVADRVGAIGIGGKRRDAHHGTAGGVLGHRVGGGIGV